MPYRSPCLSGPFSARSMGRSERYRGVFYVWSCKGPAQHGRSQKPDGMPSWRGRRNRRNYIGRAWDGSIYENTHAPVKIVVLRKSVGAAIRSHAMGSYLNDPFSRPIFPTGLHSRIFHPVSLQQCPAKMLAAFRGVFYFYKQQSTTRELVVLTLLRSQKRPETEEQRVKANRRGGRPSRSAR